GETPSIAGELYGTTWRRDGDDDDPWSAEPAMQGRWQLGFIPATSEVYAISRRSGNESTVWLRARGFTDLEQAHRGLTALMQGHRLDPNPLISAAHVLSETARTSAAPAPGGTDDTVGT